MISLRRQFGGAHELSISADVTISAGTARVWTIEAANSGRKVKLESPASWPYRLGSHIFHVYNIGATNAFDLCKSDGTVLVNVDVGEVAFVDLVSLSGTGTYRVEVK